MHLVTQNKGLTVSKTSSPLFWSFPRAYSFSLYNPCLLTRVAWLVLKKQRLNYQQCFPNLLACLDERRQPLWPERCHDLFPANKTEAYSTYVQSGQLYEQETTSKSNTSTFILCPFDILHAETHQTSKLGRNQERFGHGGLVARCSQVTNACNKLVTCGLHLRTWLSHALHVTCTTKNQNLKVSFGIHVW